MRIGKDHDHDRAVRTTWNNVEQRTPHLSCLGLTSAHCSTSSHVILTACSWSWSWSWQCAFTLSSVPMSVYNSTNGLTDLDKNWYIVRTCDCAKYRLYMTLWLLQKKKHYYFNILLLSHLFVFYYAMLNGKQNL